MAILGSKCKIDENTFKNNLEFVKNRFQFENEAVLNCVERVSNDISYEEFFKRFLLRNVPCLISATQPGGDDDDQDDVTSTRNWKISREWVLKNNEYGSPNWAFIEDKFGNSVVPVADCSRQDYNSQSKEHVWLPQYLKYCRKLIVENYDYSKMPCLYLKDWHFCRVFPDYEPYEIPVYFQSDWLNGFCKSRTDEEDDYCFVYIGPKGTWTPFHADVFGSYSWSTNICGRKRWLLFPPGAEKYFRDSKGKLAYSVTLPELDDPEVFPEAFKYFSQYGRGIEIIQEPGETIFVPSGWHHQVWNTEDTISVNHNWFNGCNIDLIWSNLFRAYKEVAEEIKDCRNDIEWSATCQLVLKAHHGINFAEFISLLEFVVARNKETIENGKKTEEDDDEEDEMENKWHIAFDFQRILFAIKSMKEEMKENFDKSFCKILTQLEDYIIAIQNKNKID